VGVVNLLVLASILRETTRKVVNFLGEENAPPAYGIYRSFLLKNFSVSLRFEHAGLESNWRCFFWITLVQTLLVQIIIFVYYYRSCQNATLQ